MPAHQTIISLVLFAQQSVPPAHDLPKVLEPVGRPLQKVIFNDQKSANVWFSLQDMTVTLSWCWTPPNVPDVGEKQVHAVPYRPTATQVYPGTTFFYVAGVGPSAGPNGSTLIEKWELGPPKTKAVRNAAGGYDHIVIPGSIRSRITVFSDPNAAEGGINFFLVNHGEPGTFFFQFVNTYNVYKLNGTTGAISLAFSGVQFPDNLLPGFVDMLELDNPDMGFLYVLLEDRLPLGANTANVCILADGNRSGVLSELHVVTFDQYQSSGFNKGTALNTHMAWPHWF